MGVNKIQFSGEGLPLFPNLSPQQLHEIFVKNPSSTGQCPCLEQLPRIADILRYSKFGYDFAISFRILPVQSILPSK
ncbi:hypothetical protein RhiirA1_482430 [Rhizophagus irregularis]|uniref:Uncharacterized protein n=1 Tax=Rhizophagus irregularis TaxID=588596 RepID=A0A2N0QLV6_9GLOM|nr:hypothetical protein RhiirA1_482430 [Rhizophagus irregularis]